MLYEFEGKKPSHKGECFIAPDATLVGDITLGVGSSVWFKAVIRADNDRVVVGENTNVQDGAVLHCDPGFPLIIGDNVTIGHQATVHGCTVGNGSLIGINATVLNGAVIGEHCLIGANALVTEGMVIPDGSLVVGAPAKILKPLNETQTESQDRSTIEYMEKAIKYRSSIVGQKMAAFGFKENTKN